MTDITPYYNRFKKSLRARVFGSIKDNEVVEELVDDTFIKAWKGNFKPIGEFSTWLFTIARNIRTDYYRKNKNPLGIVTYDAEIETLEIADEVYDYDIKDDNIINLNNKLKAKLRHTNLEIYQLHIEQGFSIEEMAKILNLSRISIRARLHRMRKALGVRTTIGRTPVLYVEKRKAKHIERPEELVIPNYVKDLAKKVNFTFTKVGDKFQIGVEYKK
jgi:RNA polymerase sigma-70 factor (ECF subfamily)